MVPPVSEFFEDKSFYLYAIKKSQNWIFLLILPLEEPERFDNLRDCPFSVIRVCTILTHPVERKQHLIVSPKNCERSAA